jgi:hypothetical protein
VHVANDVLAQASFQAGALGTFFQRLKSLLDAPIPEVLS